MAAAPPTTEPAPSSRASSSTNSTKRGSTADAAAPTKRIRIARPKSDAAAHLPDAHLPDVLVHDTHIEGGVAQPLRLLDLPVELLEDVWRAVIAQCDSVDALSAAYATTAQGLGARLGRIVGNDTFWQRNASAIQPEVAAQLFMDCLQGCQAVIPPLANARHVAPFVRSVDADTWWLHEHVRMATLMAALPRCTRLESVRLLCSHNDQATYTGLAAALADCNVLNRMSVCGIKDATGQDAFVQLLASRKLTCLEMGYCASTPSGIEALIVALPAWTTLTTLNLAGAHMDPAQWPGLLAGIASCRALVHLCLQASGLDGPAAPHLARACASFAALTELDMSDNADLGDAGLASVVGALHSCRHLTVLSLSGMRAGPRTFAALAAVVSGLHTLRVLEARESAPESEAFQDLVAALQGCAHVQVLDLDFCELTDADVASLAVAVRTLPNLTDLHLACNEFSAEGFRCLAHALMRCRRLHVLSLGGNDIGDRGVPYFEGLFAACPRLHVVDLQACGVGPNGLQELTDIVTATQPQTAFDLSGNDVGEAALRAFYVLAQRGHE